MCSILFATIALPDVTLNRIFTNNMVLQHGMPVPVWGVADTAESLSVHCCGQTKSTVADSLGHWLVRLDTLTIGGPFELVAIGKDTVTLTNVMVGDVWLCTGQSNMAFNLISFGYNASVEAAGLNDVRLNTLSSPYGWRECTPATAGVFSATAFFFGKHLYDSLHIPLGLVVGAIGATCIEQWMSTNSVLDDPDLDTSFLCPYCGGDSTDTINHKNAAGLYRKYIEPIIPFAIRGTIWYQGEWNAFVNNGVNQPYAYRVRSKELIDGWRKEWGQGNFPFYYVQLPNLLTSDDWPQIREYQRLTLQDVENTGMAITIDIGDSINIHPKEKSLVGYRLALIALEKTYGHTSLISNGPLFKDFFVRNDTAHISFDYPASGLIAMHDTLREFDIAPSDSDFVAANAFVQGNEVIVYKTGSKVTNVRYAWRSNPHPSLFNSEGLPASPFRTYAMGIPTESKPKHSPIKHKQIGKNYKTIKVFDCAGRCVLDIHDRATMLPPTVTTSNYLASTPLSPGVYIVYFSNGNLRGPVQTIFKK